MAKANLKQFDDQAVAKLDAAMWQSYYNFNKNFFSLFLQALNLVKSQLKFSWPAIMTIAYYASRAASAYRLKKGRENYPAALKNLTKFFKTISNNCTEPFDYKRTAELELEWWDIQRYPDKHKKTLEQSLAQNMAALYNTDARYLKGYGRNRAAALALLTSAQGKQKSQPDWDKVTTLLLEAWRSLHSTVQK